MCGEYKNPLRQKIEDLAEKYGWKFSTVSARALGDGRRHSRLVVRDSRDAAAMKDLARFEKETDETAAPNEAAE